MSILFCTPCYGAQVFAPHFKSCMNLKEDLTKLGIEHDWLIAWNESLITRARDKLARTFLEDTDFEYLFFIDADIEFTSQNVADLWNLQEKVSVGCYRMKKEGAPWAAWKGHQLHDLDQFTEPFDVDYAGTGFMLIHRSVFETMKTKHPEWAYEEDQGTCYGFFQDPVADGWKASEDYFFCERWRDLGGRVVMHPDVRLRHWGVHAW